MQWNSFAGSEAVCDYKKKIECNNCILMMHTKTNDITLSLVADTLQEKHKLSKMKVYNENITRNHIIYKI